MSLSTLTWFTIGACLVYAVAVDANVYPWLVLKTQRILQRIGRMRYALLNNPDSPWVRYKVDRNASRLATQFIKENQKR